MTTTNRRSFITASAVAIGAAATASSAVAQESNSAKIIEPPAGKQILISCKLGMIAKKEGERELSLVERLKLAAAAGFDGVDFDEAGNFTPEQAQAAVQESGVFVHNAINHAHWNQRLTSAKEQERAQGVKNIEHCLRVSHAAGGSGVLIVVGRGDDGPEDEINERARREIKRLIPLAASLGQPILFENVWNKMHYDHDAPPEQLPTRFIEFVDSFGSPWVGMYYDIGNHWKYGQPLAWLRAFGRRAVKLDIKGFSRAKNKFVDITSADDDVPWKEVQTGLAEIGFTGWTTAEVGGGGLERLTTVRQQMQKAFGLG
ncbi:MAG TPA: sugar phosphate isomerase/epimerase family protein [Pirellulaceae bacterium]|nr:sugar phosphate isomerase/epimerase family protein [Pirellulaceae bacterium]